MINMSTVYICIPVHNRIKYTIECIESILNQNYKKYKIVIADDGSSDGTGDILKSRYPEVVVIVGDGNLWWAGATNKCIEYVLTIAHDNDFVFTLNNDTMLEKDTIELLIARDNENVIIGAVNVFESDGCSIEPSAWEKRYILGIDFPKRVNEWGESLDKYHGTVEVDSLSGKGVLIPVKVFRSIGLYNSELLPHYHSDTEFIIRAKKNGYKVALSYDAKVLSYQNLSGIGTITSKPNIKDFVISFSSIKSTHHLPSLRNRNKLIYGNKYKIQYFISLAGIFLGFIKRYLRQIAS